MGHCQQQSSNYRISSDSRSILPYKHRSCYSSQRIICSCIWSRDWIRSNLSSMRDYSQYRYIIVIVLTIVITPGVLSATSLCGCRSSLHASNLPVHSWLRAAHRQLSIHICSTVLDDILLARNDLQDLVENQQVPWSQSHCIFCGDRALICH